MTRKRRRFLKPRQLITLEKLAHRRIVRKGEPATRVWRDLIDHPALGVYSRREAALIASILIYAGAGLEIML